MVVSFTSRLVKLVVQLVEHTGKSQVGHKLPSASGEPLPSPPAQGPPSTNPTLWNLCHAALTPSLSLLLIHSLTQTRPAQFGRATHLWSRQKKNFPAEPLHLLVSHCRGGGARWVFVGWWRWWLWWRKLLVRYSATRKCQSEAVSGRYSEAASTFAAFGF